MVSLASSQRLLSRLASSQRRALGLQARRAALRGGTSAACRSISTASAEDVQAWRDAGFLDERKLTVFETLHELQDHSCTVFNNNPLFGTYTEQGPAPSFEWMTYGEFGDKVDQCRALLKDLGEF